MDGLSPSVDDNSDDQEASEKVACDAPSMHPASPRNKKVAKDEDCV